MSQVQACQRRVAELQGSLAVLAERCGSLEQVHEGAMDRLRTFSAAKAKAKSKMTPEQLKKQSTAKVRGLQHRHGELMKSLKDILSEHPDTTWETLKKDVLPVGSPDTALPETLPETGPATLWRPEGATSSRVKVMNLDGPAAKLNSRLRFHDIQAKSPPDGSFVSNQSRDADRPPNGCGGYTPVKLGVHLQAGGPRNFPGAEAFSDSRQQGGLATPHVSRESNRVEEIRRRAAEIESQRAMTPSADAMENPLRQNPGQVGPPMAEGLDFLGTVDASKSPINEVWARFHQGDLPLASEQWPAKVSGNGCGSCRLEGDQLVQEPLTVPPAPPFVQLQPLPPPQLTLPPQGLGQAPLGPAPLPMYPGSASWSGASQLGAASWMNLPPMPPMPPMP